MLWNRGHRKGTKSVAIRKRLKHGIPSFVGLLDHIDEMSAVFNLKEKSYLRLIW